MNASVKQLTDRQNNTPVDYEKAVGKARNGLLRGLDGLFAAMLDGADDTLFTLAEKADNNQMQQVYFETMRMLRLERTNIKDTFTEKLTDSLQPGFRPDTDNDELDFDEDELTLVDQDSMEEMVAITGMYTKAMQMYKEELLHLAKRLEFIAEHTSRVFPAESVEPKNICEAFRDALAPVSNQIEIQNKLILYKLFDNKLICNLGDIYKGMNVELAGSGVLPKISIKQLVGRGSSPGFAGGGGGSAHTGAPANPYEMAVEYSRRLKAFEESNYAQYQNNTPDALDYQSVQVLSNFLQQTAGGQPAPPPTPDNNFSTNDVLNGLSLLQSTSVSDAPVTAQEIKNALIKKISTTKGGGITQQVSQLDEKTIDLIQMLFDAMTQDENVPEVIKSLLLRLQIPVIKSAMLDTEFFTNPHHPSRNLLNGLAETGTKISGDDDELVPQLEEIVDELVESYDQDVVSFQRAFDKLNSTLHDEEVKARKAEARTQRQVLRDHARVIVLKELKDQVRGRNFPAGAHALVLKNWSTVMYHRYIKHGKDSDQWFASVDTLTEIIDSLQTREYEHPSDNVAAGYTALTDKLERELLNSKLDRTEAMDALDELKEVYDFMLKKYREEEERYQREQAAIAENSKPVDDADAETALEPNEIEASNTPDADEEPLLEVSADEFSDVTDDALQTGSDTELLLEQEESEEPESIDVEFEALEDFSDDPTPTAEASDGEIEDGIEVVEIEPVPIADEQQRAETKDATEEVKGQTVDKHVTDPDASKVFPPEASEFDLTGESAEDIATAMALGLSDVIPELEMEATGRPLANDDEPEELVEISLEQEVTSESTPEEIVDTESESGHEATSDSHQLAPPIDAVPPTETALPVNDSEDFLPPLSEEEEIVAKLEPVDAYEPASTTEDVEADAQIESEASENAADEEEKAAPITLRAPEDVKPESSEATASREKAADAAAREKDLQAESKLWKLLPNDIKPGVWINLYTGYREPEIRAKLSVIIPETETLIFVDRAGFKSAEKGLEDFLTELEEGLSSVVVEHSVFDKALSSVISNLSAY